MTSTGPSGPPLMVIKMRKAVILSLVVLMVPMLLVVAVPSESEAIDVDYDREVYCYGDNPTFKHPTADSLNIDWSVSGYDENGSPVEVNGQENNDQSFTVSLEGLSYAVITQRVSHPVNADQTAQQTMLVHAMHIGDEVYDVRFWNGNEIIDTVEINNTTVVEVPGYFAMPPTDPVRDGFIFGGWFTDRSFVANSEFDPRQPITGDMDVYAKWTSVITPGGDSSRVDVENHVVTFQCDTGLTYNLLTNTGGIITFEVLEESGYDVVWSTVEVTADYCDVSYLNGVYTLSSINSDVIVQITGEVVTSDNPNTPSNNGGTDYTLYAILLIILAVICIALAVYIMRTRGSRV